MSLKKPNVVDFVMESASEELHIVLRGHLHIEALMDEIIRRSFVCPTALDDYRQSFFVKVKLLRALGLIDEKLEQVLLALNSLRNKVAHRLHFVVTFDDAFSLVKSAAGAGVDFSDDTIHFDRKLSEEWYGTIGVLLEVFSNVFQELVWQNEALFTKGEISDFLG